MSRTSLKTLLGKHEFGEADILSGNPFEELASSYTIDSSASSHNATAEQTNIFTSGEVNAAESSPDPSCTAGQPSQSFSSDAVQPSSGLVCGCYFDYDPQSPKCKLNMWGEPPDDYSLRLKQYIQWLQREDKAPPDKNFALEFPFLIGENVMMAEFNITDAVEVEVE